MRWKLSISRKASRVGRLGIIALQFTLVATIGQPIQAEELQDDVPEDPRHGIAVYGGPASPTPLLEIARFRELGLIPESMLAISYSYRIYTAWQALAFELESTLGKHTERWDLYSIAGAFIVRWLRPPWSSVTPGSFAFGNGMSYATGFLDAETKYIFPNSRPLYHFSLEATASIPGWRGWEGLIRIHHRSGAFGMFDGVVGGSDFICLGLRKRI